MIQNRILNPYEKKQLNKYGVEVSQHIIGNMPVEYLTGHAEFCGHDFIVTQDTLIPRIETEEIIDILDNTFKLPFNETINIADIGTGSGCLGISVAISLYNKGYRKIYLILSDQSTSALKIATINSSRLLPKEINCSIFQSDLLSQYPTNQSINLLLANLPYVPSSRIPKLDSSVKDFEPHLALDGGPDGTLLINKLLSQLTPFINSNFQSIFEIDSTHKMGMFNLPSTLKAEFIKDQFQRNRFLILSR